MWADKSCTSVKPNENKLKMKHFCENNNKRITLQPHNIISEMKNTFSNQNEINQGKSNIEQT